MANTSAEGMGRPFSEPREKPISTNAVSPATESTTLAPDGNTATTESKASVESTESRHKRFRSRVGIREEIPIPSKTSRSTEALLKTKRKADCGAGSDKEIETFNHMVNHAYWYHTYQYWFVATVANGLLWIQITLAATLTALGAVRTHKANTAIIFIGAINTVIAGLLTYFKSRNQPNRARQFRNDLKTVYDALNEADAAFADPYYKGDVEIVTEALRKQYDGARADAAANYPDLWISLRNIVQRGRESTGGNPQNSSTGQNGNDKEQEKIASNAV